MNVLANLHPTRVFAIFEQLSAIPHGSGNTAAIGEWCCAFARRLGLSVIRDRTGNVMMKKSGSAGRENEPPVILQAHLDMVCEKTAEKEFDFLTQGISLVTDGDKVWADGTTLGADNGIGMAMILALMEDNTLSHPPLEGVLTVDEETGLEGAAAIDFANLDGRRMINLDSEDEGVFTAGCAGGIRLESTFAVTHVANKLPAFSVQVKGLMGGHSGIEINKRRANANRELAFLLKELSQQGTVRLAELNGGTVDNAIAAEAACLMATDLDYETVCALASKTEQALIEQGEPAARVLVASAEIPSVWEEAQSKAVLEYLTQSPNGVQAMCKDLPTLVETSLNLGVIRCNETSVSVTFSLRSAVEAEKTALLDRLKGLAVTLGATAVSSGAYPGWEYRADSALQETMKQVYANLYGKQPTVDVIHAGLECGLFCEKCPALDAVSIGPDMRNVHSPDEWVSVASVGRVYEYLVALLANIV